MKNRSPLSTHDRDAPLEMTSTFVPVGTARGSRFARTVSGKHIDPSSAAAQRVTHPASVIDVLKKTAGGDLYEGES